MKQAEQKQQTPQAIESKDPPLPDEIREAIERESLPQNQIQVAKTLSNPHPLITKWIEQEEREEESYRKYGGWRKPERASELEKRRRRIISALLKAIEARGFKAEADKDYRQFIWIKHQRDQIGFTITERIRQNRIELTKEEKKDHWNTNAKWRQVSEATGMLMLRISLAPRGSSYSAKDFQETAEQPLENQLNAVVVGIIEKMWEIKKRRLDHEENERQRWEKRKEAEQQAKLLKEEQQRKTSLETKAADWKKASMIREYVAAVINANEDKSLSIDEKALANWKEWALAHAQELDPIAAGNPLIDLARPVDEEKEDEFQSEYL